MMGSAGDDDGDGDGGEFVRARCNLVLIENSGFTRFFTHLSWEADYGG